MQSKQTDAARKADADLILRCAAGERKARFELYSRYSKAVFASSFRILNNREDAEDILQETFITAFARLNSFRAEASLGTWLKRIAANNSVNFLRKRKLNLVHSDSIEFAAEEPEDFRNIEFEIDRVKEAVKQLADGYRLVFSLYLFDGFDHSEISQILGISESSSKSQLSRAKKRVAEYLRK